MTFKQTLPAGIFDGPLKGMVRVWTRGRGLDKVRFNIRIGKHVCPTVAVGAGAWEARVDMRSKVEEVGR